MPLVMTRKEEIALDFITVYKKYKDRTYFSRKMKEVSEREKLHKNMKHDEAEKK